MVAVPTQIKMSPAFKEHVAEYAAARNITLSECIRQAAARMTGYDLGADDETEVQGRPRKYQTAEARKEAARARARERSDHDKAVLTALMKQERLNSIESLRRWLTERGINVDDDD